MKKISEIVKKKEDKIEEKNSSSKSISSFLNKPKIEEVPEEPESLSIFEQVKLVNQDKKPLTISFGEKSSIVCDETTAEVILNVYENLSPNNQKTFLENLERDIQSFSKVVFFSYSQHKED
jgi:hypothetical protein